MRTEKVILRKINEWKNNPMLVSGVYRLFTYLPWEKIPDEYKEFFPEEAKEKWNDDLKTYTKENILLDIGAQINALVKVMAKKNITHSIGLIPMIMADIFMYGKSIIKIQTVLNKLIKEYKDYIMIDRNLAEQYSAIILLDLLRYIIKYVNIEFTYDFEDAAEKVMEKYKDKENIITKEVDEQINKALKDYDDTVKGKESKEDEQ